MKFSVLCLVVFWFCLAQAQPQTPVSQSLLPGGPDKWELVWSDEFDGPDAELERKWKSQNGPSGHILSSRWRENAAVTNGFLRLVARKEKRGGQEWTAGSLWTREMFHEWEGTPAREERILSQPVVRLAEPRGHRLGGAHH